MLKRMISFMLVLVLLLCCVQAGGAAPRRLRYGMKGNDVKQLQTALQGLGLYKGKIDGVFGRGTLKAVRTFQTQNGLEVDGIAGPLTQEKLYGSEEEEEEGRVLGVQADNAAEQSIGTAARYDPTGEFFPEDFPEQVDSFLQSMAARSGASCGTLVLSKNGQTFLTWSFGGVDEKTCFRIASVTKWVTAIGLMTLYDAGKLDLDRDISDYLGFTVRNPAYPNKAITARMLLTHTSSLSPDASNYHPDWERIGKKGYDPIFNESTEPGTKYAYADYNGALFGCLIEAISKKSVQNYLDEKVFTPLGLTAAYSPKFLPPGTPAKDLLAPDGKVAISVQRDRSRAYNNVPDPKGNNGYTVGKLYINTESLTKLAQMMYYGGELDGVRILNAETVKLMEAEQPSVAESRYGLSNVRLGQFDRGMWYGHQGRYSGLSSNVYYQRETGITMALVMNGYDYRLEDNIVEPAVTILRNMDKIETMCLGGNP